MKVIELGIKTLNGMRRCALFLLDWKKQIEILSLALLICCIPTLFYSYWAMSKEIDMASGPNRNIPRAAPLATDSSELQLCHAGCELMASWAELDQVVANLSFLGVDQRPDADEGGSVIVESKKRRYLMSSTTPLPMHYSVKRGWAIAQDGQLVHKLIALGQIAGQHRISVVDKSSPKSPSSRSHSDQIELDLKLDSKSLKKADDPIAQWRKTKPLWHGFDRFYHHRHPTSKPAARLQFSSVKRFDLPKSIYFLRWQVGQIVTFDEGRWQHLPLGPKSRQRPIALLEELKSKELRVRLWDRWGLGSELITCHATDDRLDERCLQSLKLIAARSRDRFALQVNEVTLPIALGSCLHWADGRWQMGTSPSHDEEEGNVEGELLIFYALFKKGGLWRVKGELFSRGKSASKKIELCQEMPTSKAVKPPANPTVCAKSKKSQRAKRASTQRGLPRV